MSAVLAILAAWAVVALITTSLLSSALRRGREMHWRAKAKREWLP